MRAIRLGRLSGIPVEVHPTWLVVFGLVSWSLAHDYYPLEFPGRPPWLDVTSGVATALLFFACLTAHELSHSLVARRAGIRVNRITLFLFGGVSELTGEPRTPSAEVWMAIAGPGASLGIACAFFISFRWAVTARVATAVWAPLVTLSMANVVIALFNMTPGFPMDGGRVLRAFLWWASGDRRLSTRAAGLAGQGIGVALAVAGIWSAATGSLSGAWLVLLGAFLTVLAGRAYSSQASRLRLAGTPVAAVASTRAPCLPASAPASEIAPALLSSPMDPILVVVDGDRMVGVLTADPETPAGRSDATAGELARHPDPAMLIDAAESLETALLRLDRAGAGALLVVRAGRVVGEVSHSRLATDPSLVETGH
jgi:Zn-dependent protease